MKNHISFSVLLLTTVLLIGTFAAIPWFNANAAQDSNADFVTIEGVAGNDYYDSRQYSYDVNQWAHDYEQIPWYPIVDPANVWFTAAKSIRLGQQSKEGP